jgi:hypothetical protein
MFCGCFCFVAIAGEPDDILFLGIAPLLPFIISAPAWIFAMGLEDSETNQLVAAYVLGTIGYICVNAAMIVDLFRRFDARTGRTTETPT